MNWFFLANASTNRIWTPKLHEEFRKHTEINASIWLFTGLNAKKKQKHVPRSRTKPTKAFSQNSRPDHMESVIYKLDTIYTTIQLYIT